MSLDKINSTLDTMLAIQQEFQRDQLALSCEIRALKASVQRRNEIGMSHEQAWDSDWLDLSQKLQNLERRVDRLEREKN